MAGGGYRPRGIDTGRTPGGAERVATEMPAFDYESYANRPLYQGASPEQMMSQPTGLASLYSGPSYSQMMSGGLEGLMAPTFAPPPAPVQLPPPVSTGMDYAKQLYMDPRFNDIMKISNIRY